MLIISRTGMMPTMIMMVDDIVVMMMTISSSIGDGIADHRARADPVGRRHRQQNQSEADIDDGRHHHRQSGDDTESCASGAPEV